MSRFLLIAVVVWLLLPSCDGNKSTQTDLQLNLNAKFENQDFMMQQAYLDQNNNMIRFAVVKFYLSDVVLVKDDNSKVELSDIELVDFNSSSSYTIDAEIDEGTYTALEFGLGVSPDLNSMDPSMFPNEHPLSSFANTFWTWSSKYRFALIEGDVDTSGDMSFPVGFVYHTGLDTLYMTKQIPLNINATGGAVSIDLNVQTDKIFFNSGKEIDYINESATHTTDNLNLAARVTENLFTAIQ